MEKQREIYISLSFLDKNSEEKGTAWTISPDQTADIRRKILKDISKTVNIALKVLEDERSS